MNRILAVVVLCFSILIPFAAAFGQVPKKDEAGELRDEIRHVEAAILELTARLKSLRERLAKIDGQKSVVPQALVPAVSLPQATIPATFRFPVETERAMLHDGQRPLVRAPQLETPELPPTFTPRK